MIRPTAQALLSRWSEVMIGALCAALGLWLAVQGGYVLLPLGTVIALLAAVYGLAAYRRISFAQNPAAVGVIEVTEGQIAYFAQGDAGGFIALGELVELRLITLSRRRFWRLKQQDGQALLIPIDAAGNAALFDAFASLPQMDSAALLAALTAPPRTDHGAAILWRRAPS
jgi:hypothetical protein